MNSSIFTTGSAVMRWRFSSPEPIGVDQTSCGVLRSAGWAVTARSMAASSPLSTWRTRCATMLPTSCNNCARSVHRALSAVAGVASVQVDLDAGTAHVRGSELDASALRDAVKAVTAMIEPIMIIVMGAAVGFIAMAIILPIFKMIGSLNR